jgi:hypothetical protein
MKLNNAVFLRTGKLMEKYNVVDTQLEAVAENIPGRMDLLDQRCASSIDKKIWSATISSL